MFQLSKVKLALSLMPMMVWTGCQVDREPSQVLDSGDEIANRIVDECDTTAQCKQIFGPEATDCKNSQSNSSVCMCGNTPCSAQPDPTPDPDPVPEPPQDECDTTAQCKQIFGPEATDCKNSQSDSSVCMCGDTPCTDVDQPGPDPGPDPDPSFAISGELRKWHDIVITFTGPNTNENATPNPFTDFRLNVTFTHESGLSFVVPGYYAADGNAANTGANSGNKWRVHFAPNATGAWTFSASFRTGTDIAVNSNPNAGSPTGFHGATGSFNVARTNKSGRDLRGKGRLEYVGERYLRFAETGEFYIKAGADSPENFLAFFEFDQTPNSHRYAPHANDWQAGDPVWRGNRGKNIIGAINYLASVGMNSIYFLTMNVTGDGDDVWPWTSKNERRRFDVSKLDQWEIVFRYMEASGIQMHVVTQETENDQLLNNGNLGVARRLYYRELIARFAHHAAIVWNLGEENTNTNAQRRQFASFFKDNDPYQHPVVIHTFPGQKESVFSSLLGFGDLDGPSLQVANNAVVRDWIDRSASAGHQWVVNYDEQGPANTGVKPDKDDNNHDSIRKDVLWGTLMAGGAGVEYYFGYQFDHNDLDCEDWRSRDRMWELTDIALDFFHSQLPFDEMNHANNLASGNNNLVLAKPGQVYAVYLRNGGSTQVQVGNGTYSVKWFNPRTGGGLQNGSVQQISGPGTKGIGNAPNTPNQDWVVLLRRQ